MRHPLSRSEKRQDRYSTLIQKGETSTMDSLYKSEVKKLEKMGYTVEVLSPHPKLRNLLLCQVFFPESELTEK